MIFKLKMSIKHQKHLICENLIRHWFNGIKFYRWIKVSYLFLAQIECIRKFDCLHENLEFSFVQSAIRNRSISRIFVLCLHVQINDWKKNALWIELNWVKFTLNLFTLKQRWLEAVLIGKSNIFALVIKLIRI